MACLSHVRSYIWQNNLRVSNQRTRVQTFFYHMQEWQEYAGKQLTQPLLLYWCKHRAHLLEETSRSDPAVVFPPSQWPRGEIRCQRTLLRRRLHATQLSIIYTSSSSRSTGVVCCLQQQCRFPQVHKTNVVNQSPQNKYFKKGVGFSCLWGDVSGSLPCHPGESWEPETFH